MDDPLTSALREALSPFSSFLISRLLPTLAGSEELMISPSLLMMLTSLIPLVRACFRYSFRRDDSVSAPEVRSSTLNWIAFETSVELSWISCTRSFWLYWFMTNRISMAMTSRESMMITSFAFSFTANSFDGAIIQPLYTTARQSDKEYSRA